MVNDAGTAVTPGSDTGGGGGDGCGSKGEMKIMPENLKKFGG